MDKQFNRIIRKNEAVDKSQVVVLAKIAIEEPREETPKVESEEQK